MNAHGFDNDELDQSGRIRAEKKWSYTAFKVLNIAIKSFADKPTFFTEGARVFLISTMTGKLDKFCKKVFNMWYEVRTVYNIFCV